MWSDSAGQTTGIEECIEPGLWLCYRRGRKGCYMGHDVRMLGGGCEGIWRTERREGVREKTVGLQGTQYEGPVRSC